MLIKDILLKSFMRCFYVSHWPDETNVRTQDIQLFWY